MRVFQKAQGGIAHLSKGWQGIYIPGVRPIVIKDETRILLEEYRKFRHLVRNIYTFNIIPQKVIKLAKGITRSFNALKKDIKKFINLIEKISR